MSMDELRATITADPAAPKAARLALGQLAEGVAPARLGDATLVLSELVSNAVRHRGKVSRGKVEVVVSMSDAHVRMEVSDDGPGFDPALVWGSGFGLKLVDRLSSQWGVESTRTGTMVWAEVPIMGDGAEA